MKSIKPLILTAILSVSVATASAGGIPVFDGVANGRDTIHQAQEIIQMAKEVKQWADTIKHYSNELKQLKDTHNALSGLKKLVSYDPDVRDLVNGFEDLMKGNPDKILSRAEKYFDGLDKLCQDAKNKEVCQNASLSEIVQLDFSEKLHKKFEDEMNNIDILQKKAASASDAKSIAEVQAAIALQQNKIQLLAIQTENFNRLQQAQKEIARKQAWEKADKTVWDSYKIGYPATATTQKETGYSDLFQ
ncbi:MAG: hypothetical protein J5680_04445 [Neisseriaceae bacterium]|nr:hypothetical protein [Neisseriaceae bacterium]